MPAPPFIADPHPSEFIRVEVQRDTMLVRRGYEEWAHLLGPGAASPAGASVTGGRRPHPLVTLPSGERVVVRAYQRGGLVRHLNRSRYFLGHRAFDELRATEHARRAGVRVPAVLAAAERRESIGYTATLTTRWIPDAGEGAAWLMNAPPAQRRAMCEEAGRQIGRMHKAGIGHPDLNLRNLLVVGPHPRLDAEASRHPLSRLRTGGEDLARNPTTEKKPLRDEFQVYLLDFDRARIFGGPVPPRWRARNLRRLLRSARKLGDPLGPAEWTAMRRGYGAGWPLDDLG